MSHSCRIQKWLSELGALSRRQAEAYIKDNRIKVNGVLATIGMKVSPSSDQITIDGKLQKKNDSKPAKLYWAFNKPDFTLVSRVAQKDMKTIYEIGSLSRVSFKLNTVGRLDYRTEGLLLLSNDGDLIHQLCHPKNEVPRVYHVLLSKKLDRSQLNLLNEKGLSLQGKAIRCKVSLFHSTNLGKSTGAWYEVTVYEGRNRLIRRMFEKIDLRVVRLVRVSYAGFSLPLDLKPGGYRSLSSEEIRSLRKFVT